VKVNPEESAFYNRRLTLMVNLMQNQIKSYDNLAFCSRYTTNSTAVFNLTLFVDDLNTVNKCQLRQMKPEYSSAQIYTTKRTNCSLRAFAAKQDVITTQVKSIQVNNNNLHFDDDDTSSEENFDEYYYYESPLNITSDDYACSVEESSFKNDCLYIENRVFVCPPIN
jgi:hypothetical protein